MPYVSRATRLAAIVSCVLACSCKDLQESGHGPSGVGGTADVESKETVGPRITTQDRTELFSHLGRACDSIRSGSGASSVTIRLRDGVLVAENGLWAREITEAAAEVILAAFRNSPDGTAAARALPVATGFTHGDSLGTIQVHGWGMTVASDGPGAYVLKATHRSSTSNTSQ